MKKTIKSIIKKTPGFDSLNLLRFRVNYFLKDDEIVIKERYKKIFGRELNLENPRTFNEKIQWRILKDRKDIYTKLADKYLVRDYIKEKIGEEFLIKLLGVYEKAEDIDYDRLPNKFVLKCNHDSGSVIICKDKSKFDKKEANKKLNFFLKRNFYYMTREWHYKNIKPLIICEEFLGEDPDEFRVWVFNGKVHYISTNLFEVNLKNMGKKKIKGRSFYNSNWELQNFSIGYPVYKIKEKKPQFLEELIKLSETLATQFDQCRVDFYFTSHNELKFGELTFTHAAGTQKFYPIGMDKEFGKLFKIKEEK
ncbi:MAG: ATP-grasp fold amidoligase family protein [Bacilli bacterium]